MTENSAVVAWSTDGVTTGLVRLFDIQSGKVGSAEEETRDGRSQVPRAIFMSAPGQRHRVRLSGLQAGTRYRYVVAVRRPGDLTALETATPQVEFSTASNHGPFVFLVYGDTRDRDGDHATVVHAMLSEHADLVLQTGDMVSRASDEAQWRRYFATASPLLKNTPLYPTLGNHELRGDPEAGHFHQLFILPGGASSTPPHRRHPTYYSFRYNNSLFLALDGNAPYDQDQSTWLEWTLRGSQGDSSLRHVFVFVHQPPFAVGAYCGSERVARRLVPILQRYSVRAVFAGHEHAYQHLERDGLRYFISGGGGAPLYPRSQACNFEDDMSLRMFRAEHHYLRVLVDGDTATLEAIDRRGVVMERVALHEPIPDIPPPPPPLVTPATAEKQVFPTLTPRFADPPLLALSTTAPPATAISPPRRLTASGNGPLVLLWLSSIALLAGLLMLTRDLRPRRP